MVGKAEILKLPSLMVSAEFIRKFWACAEPAPSAKMVAARRKFFMNRGWPMAVSRSVLAVTAVLAGGTASAQDRTQQYLGLARATLEQPVTHSELEAAILSPAGVRDIGALFAKAIAAGITVGGV